MSTLAQASHSLRSFLASVETANIEIAMPVDYSKWDSLVVSDSSDCDDEAVHESQGSGSSRSAGNAALPDRIQELAAEKARELRRFLCTHPCPSNATVTAWVLKVFELSPIDETGQRLRHALQECRGRFEDFEYEAFQKMWLAGGQQNETKVLRQVGEALNSKGGFACMQLNFYVFSFALRGHEFISGPKPLVVNCYPRDIEMCWHGIGLWQE